MKTPEGSEDEPRTRFGRKAGLVESLYSAGVLNDGLRNRDGGSVQVFSGVEKAMQMLVIDG